MKTWALLMGSGENASEGGRMRAFFALFLIAGIAFSGYGVYEYFRYSAPSVPVTASGGASADKARLDKMIENIQTATATRSNSVSVVDGAQAVARYPFGAPVVAPIEAVGAGVVPAQVAIIPDAELGGKYDNVPTEVAPEIVPPYISVKGIISVGQDTVAMMNIEDEPDGKIYRVGDGFAGNKGKITQITPNKVTVRFGGKNFEFPH